MARRFLAAVSPDALRRAQRVALRERATGEAFTFSREVLLEPGFLEVLQTRRDDEGGRLVERLPAAGAAVALRVDAVPRERQTRPPDRLTEAECVALMEKHGIGTDASIPSHIENVCKRNYVQVDSGRRLWPTTLGLALARGFGVVVCASSNCPDAVRCAARRRRVAEAIKRAPPDQPCACVAGACDAAGLARAFARLGGDESLCRICG